MPLDAPVTATRRPARSTLTAIDGLGRSATAARWPDIWPGSLDVMAGPDPLRHTAVAPSDRIEQTAHALTWLLVVLTATWIGHSIEYVRVYGSRGVWTQLAGSAHLYMGPLGVVLTGLVVVGAARWRGRGRELHRRLATGQTRLRTGRPGPDALLVTAPTPPPVRPSGFIGDWLGLLAGQLVVYTVQENVEGLSVRGRAPGVGVLTGVHWAAPLIHAGIALAVTVALVTLQRHRSRLLASVRVIERLVGRLWAIRPPQPALSECSSVFVAPHRRWGRQRWQRPPPVSIVA
jgi:hypothetical protein